MSLLALHVVAGKDGRAYGDQNDSALEEESVDNVVAKMNYASDEER